MAAARRRGGLPLLSKDKHGRHRLGSSRLVCCLPCSTWRAGHMPRPLSTDPHRVLAGRIMVTTTHALHYRWHSDSRIRCHTSRLQLVIMSRQNTPVQLTFDDARKPTGRGGWRPNAGRPKGRTTVPHASRDDFSPRIPQHVTLKIVPNLPSLRDERLVGLIRTQIALSQRPDYRIIEFSVQHDHLHFINEADGIESLGDGIHDLKIRIARRLNRELARRDELFAERYHNRSLSSPREVRNAMRYVLNNERHHADERGKALDPRWLDPFSSAPWFDGWAAPIQTSSLPARALALASVWLLTTGWRRHGLIRCDEVPGRRLHGSSPPR